MTINNNPNTLRDDIADQVTAKASEGCCNDAAYRYHLCPFHQGYQDGADAVLAHPAIAHALAVTRAALAWDDEWTRQNAIVPLMEAIAAIPADVREVLGR
jgi:hypothetical protein